jgi:hypothetical protein
MKFTTFMMRVWLIIVVIIVIFCAVLFGTEFIHIPIIAVTAVTILLHLFYKLIDNLDKFD